MAQNLITMPPTRSVGLTSAAVKARLAMDGFNELPAPDHRGFLRIIWEVIRQPMFALLIGSGVVYLLNTVAASQAFTRD